MKPTLPAVEVTEEMLKAGERVLNEAGIVEYEIRPRSEYPLLKAIFEAMDESRRRDSQKPEQTFVPHQTA